MELHYRILDIEKPPILSVTFHEFDLTVFFQEPQTLLSQLFPNQCQSKGCRNLHQAQNSKSPLRRSICRLVRCKCRFHPNNPATSYALTRYPYSSPGARSLELLRRQQSLPHGNSTVLARSKAFSTPDTSMTCTLMGTISQPMKYPCSVWVLP